MLDRNFGGYACPRCNELLEVVVDPPTLSAKELKSLWSQRRASFDPLDRSGVWRFREVLPDYPAGVVVTMAEGNSPLVPGHKATMYGGIGELRFKHLGWNPTGCFKDLGMTVAISEARLRGKSTVACASTGNTAASMAAYAAHAGIKACVYLPKGKISRAKLAQSIDYGAEIVEVDGNFDDALKQVTSRADSDVYLLNSINPFRVEGQKTAIYEVMEELNWEAPDYLVLPGGNLGNSAAFGKAIEEMHNLGLIARMPKMVVVQASGANPFARLWRNHSKELRPTERPHTYATAICIGNPRSWKKALRVVTLTGGTVLEVSDDEIREAKTVIGREGIGCEPASATTLAGLRQLTHSGAIPREASAVAILTGHVLKDTDAILAPKKHKHHAYEYVICNHCGWDLIGSDGRCNRCGETVRSSVGVGV